MRDAEFQRIGLGGRDPRTIEDQACQVRQIATGERDLRLRADLPAGRKGAEENRCRELGSERPSREDRSAGDEGEQAWHEAAQ